MTGFLVVGAECPSCAGAVVYNGNYFCSEACGWAMDQNDPEHRSPADRRILALAGVDTWGNPVKKVKT